MPEEKKEHKKFKAVTEELTPPVTEPTLEPNTQTTEIIEDKKPEFGVVETKNIVPHEGVKHESGIFLKFFLVTFLATLLALALAGGIYVYLTGTKVNTRYQALNSNNGTPIATQTPVVMVSPTPNVDLSTYKVSVLNGNGGIGVASKLKTIIEKAGFKVTNLGNADNFNFTDTLIQTKPEVSESAISTLKDSLADTYSIKVGDPLDAASTYDIVITVGSK